MSKVLVPIDNSENAKRALQHAIALAQQNRAIELHIVTAHEPPIVYGEVAVYLPEEKARELQRRHSEDILKPAVELARAAGVQVTTDVLIGDIAGTIARCADKKGCDAIVMGTRGMSAIGNFVMGSIATKVLHITKLPVTLVK